MPMMYPMNWFFLSFSLLFLIHLYTNKSSDKNTEPIFHYMCYTPMKKWTW